MSDPSIRDLYPENGRVMLTGGGQEFIEKIGIDAAKHVVLNVLKGENIRTQTEPLTRRRVAQVAGAIVALFARGWAEVDDFTAKLSSMALDQIRSSRQNDNATVWPAQWLIGLTGKSVQNVLRSKPEAREAYIADFESAISEAAAKCESDFGSVRMTLGFVESDDGRRRELNWHDIARLTTAIGSATLTIRGSDKSIYGKLFERLVLGSVLTILGFKHTNGGSETAERVFWLSDSSDVRECDATVILRPGKLARFDIGFIGKGNPEIMKDKLTRYAAEVEMYGITHVSQTFIIVDRMPKTQKTDEAAAKSGAEVVQMSMQYWPSDLARRMYKRLGYKHELTDMPDEGIDTYLEEKLRTIPIQDFLVGVSGAELSDDAALPSADEQLEAYEDEE